MQLQDENQPFTEGKIDCGKEDDEPDKIPTHHLEFCPLGFIPTKANIITLAMIIDHCHFTISQGDAGNQPRSVCLQWAEKCSWGHGRCLDG